jgi:hypothetical protein
LLPNTSAFLQTTLAAVAHLAEGQQTLNTEKSLVYRAETLKTNTLKGGQNLG